MHNFTQTFEEGMFVRRREKPSCSKTLLFIHGLGESGICFEKLVQRKELNAFNILLPDLPGYGRSLWPEAEPLNLESAANNLAQWLHRHHPKPVTVIGHSMGGVLALLLAEQHPDLVHRVIDIDGNISPADCVFSSQAVAMEYQYFMGTGFDDLRESSFIKGIADTAQKGYYVSLRLADARTYYCHSNDLVRLAAPLDLATRLGNLPMPAIYLAGFPHGVSSLSRQLLLEAHVAMTDIAPSGHWPFIDQEDQFTLALLENLTGA